MMVAKFMPLGPKSPVSRANIFLAANASYFNELKNKVFDSWGQQPSPIELDVDKWMPKMIREFLAEANFTNYTDMHDVRLSKPPIRCEPMPGRRHSFAEIIVFTLLILVSYVVIVHIQTKNGNKQYDDLKPEHLSCS